MDLKFAEYRATRQFNALNGLRGLSILAVLAHHSAGQLAWLPMSRYERGFLGVDLFFVISGFLIVTLLLRERSSTGQISLKQFYIRRALRILPLYYAILFVTTIIYGMLKSNVEVTRAYWGDFPFLATHTSNLLVLQVATPLFVAWSLATEEQFYLCWPAIEKWLTGKWLWLTLVGLLIANQIVNFQLANGLLESIFGSDWDRLLILQITLTPILFGVLLAHLLHKPGTFAVTRRFVGFRYGSFFWGGMLLVAVNIPQEDIRGPLRLTIQLLMALFLGSCVVREDHQLRTFLNWQPLARIGAVSYGIYLFHMFLQPIALALLTRFGWVRPEAIFLLTLTMSLLVAEASYVLFETRFLKLKGRHTPERYADRLARN